METGIHNAVETYSDFNVAVHLSYYDPYDYHSFAEASGQILSLEPDGVMFAPTVPQYTKPFTDELTQHNIPYIYIAVSYTHLTLPTNREVYISVGAVALKKKKKTRRQGLEIRAITAINNHTPNQHEINHT